MANNRVGAVDQNANAGNMDIARQQAAAIGATIGPDGWWYKDGQKLSHDQADALVNTSQVGVSGNANWGKGKGTLRDVYDKEPQWLKTVQTLGIDTGHPQTDQARTAAALAAVGPIAAAGSGLAGTAATAGTVGTAGTAAPTIIDAIKAKLPSLGKVGDVLTGNNGLNALAAAQIANAAYNGKKSSDYAEGAMKSTQDWYNQRAPLRAQGIAGMQAAPTQLPQLSAISAAGNPFARQG